MQHCSKSHTVRISLSNSAMTANIRIKILYSPLIYGQIFFIVDYFLAPSEPMVYPSMVVFTAIVPSV